jgi:hypothetical protein
MVVCVGFTEAGDAVSNDSGAILYLRNIFTINYLIVDCSIPESWRVQLDTDNTNLL